MAVAEPGYRRHDLAARQFSVQLLGQPGIDERCRHIVQRGSLIRCSRILPAHDFILRLRDCPGIQVFENEAGSSIMFPPENVRLVNDLMQRTTNSH